VSVTARTIIFFIVAYLLYFSVVAFDGGVNYYILPSLFFINKYLAYGMLSLLAFLAVLKLIVNTNNTLDRYFLTFVFIGFIFVLCSLIYSKYVPYISYNQLGFAILGGAFLYSMRNDPIYFFSMCIYPLAISVLFCLLMSWKFIHNNPLPIERLIDIELYKNGISYLRPSSGLYGQTNASGAFYALSTLTYYATWSGTRNRKLLVGMLVSFIGLIHSFALGPILLTLTLIILTLKVRRYFILSVSAFLLLNADKLLIYLFYKAASGGVKLNIWLEYLDSFIEEPMRIIFGQFVSKYYSSGGGIFYTESSFLDLINNFGIVAFLVIYLLFLMVMLARKKFKGQFVFIAPFILSSILIIIQNSSLMCCQLIQLFLYSNFLRNIKTNSSLTREEPSYGKAFKRGGN